MTTADTWALLKNKTQQDGIIAKLNSMHTALCIKFSHSTPTSSMIGNICNLLASIYEGGSAPTREEWSIVLMLNALEGSDYNWLCWNLVSQFTNACTTQYMLRNRVPAPPIRKFGVPTPTARAISTQLRIAG